ncbi:MAG: hypothetical protein COV10_01635 [Candidatus Vogelbacteria bacterium CG10_big_fil_rev_8_21_14_0_10_51_16]|uniref:TrbC/VIRB2 family protein n=1 Tax=Candidatus Vogelbacteria bacterium CG10_big_fil_rev_8_21_14_0_10_51_16 TaxID=1975045 RepID=A0A2H0RER0_9BACT|nr:MAG: hypothetical protein COV10_01635 [Candidatus Vogelbacteria bacterium CG10_big_fil_rev_8_21_14_0_10_51_16]
MPSKRQILLCFLLLVVAGLPFLAFAESGPLQGQIVNCGEKVPCSFAELVEVANRFIRFMLFNIAIPISIVAIVFVGIRMVWAQGDTGKYEAAKKSLWNLLIGLTLIIIAGLLVITILDLLKVKKDFILTDEIRGSTR